MKAALLAIAIVSCALATEPRKSAQEYPANGDWPDAHIGAEYTVHSYSSGRQTYVAKDFLIVEIAFYPKNPIQLEEDLFRLVVNKRFPLA